LQKDKLTFDPDALDRLDYFIAQLKKNGIYVDLILHAGREYPGFQRWTGAPGSFKAVDHFFSTFIDLQHKYARTLLTHVNTYTGKAYIDEPAVALIEISNEDGLIQEWTNGTLDAMPDPFATSLQKQWNDWLKKKYSDQGQLASAWAAGADPLGQEMLKPVHEAWKIEERGEAKGTLQFEAGDAGGGETLHVHVTKPGGKDNLQAQVAQAGLACKAGKTYTIKFRVKSDAPRKITLGVTQAHDPWKVFTSRDLNLTSEWQDVYFPAPVGDNDDKSRLLLSNLSTAVGDIWVSGVSMRPGGVVALKEGETLGTIRTFLRKEINSRTLAAQRDWTAFMVDMESNYFGGMRHYVRDELHAHALVVGTAAGSSPWLVQSKLDVVDCHGYWQRPQFPHKPWDPIDWIVKNVPMAGTTDGGALPSIALRRVAGKPFIVTAYNSTAPNTYSSEAFLELCAVAGLQDWDGVFADDYSQRTNAWDTKRMTSYFDIDQHPTKMATLPAAVALFLRGDIQPPGPLTVAETTLDFALESIRKGGPGTDSHAYGIPREAAFRYPIGMRIGSELKWNPPAGESPGLCSADGQFNWDTKTHRMLVITARSAGVVGSVQSGETIELGHVRVIPGETKQNWATINATVIDGADFAHAHRILITATGLCENTGMRWKDADKSSVGSDWGSAPTIVEGINATINFPFLKGAKAWALDSSGQRKTEVPIKRVLGRTQLEIASEHQTLWWEIAMP
jgi:hypothetical protein